MKPGNYALILSLLAFCVVVSDISCNKNYPEPSSKPEGTIIKGRIFDSCSGNPVRNKEFSFWKNYMIGNNFWGDNVPEHWLLDFTTDVNGFFSFTLDANNRKHCSIRSSNNVLISGEFPNIDFDLGTLYLSALKSNFKLVFQNDSNFVKEDTLILNSSYEVLTTDNLRKDIHETDTVIGKNAAELFFTKKYLYNFKYIRGITVIDHSLSVRLEVEGHFKTTGIRTKVFSITKTNGCDGHTDTIYLKI